jgi:hypothetical protein
MTATTAVQPPHTPWRRLLITGVGLAVIVALVVIAFLWPTVSSTVKALPVGVVGQAAMTHDLESALDAKAPGVFRFVVLQSRSSAVASIESRAIYGAIVLGQSPQVLTASAGSPVVSQLLTTLAPALQARINAELAAKGIKLGTPITVAVTDVVPLAATDPRGAGLVASSFPLVLGGMLGGVLIALLVVGIWRRLAAVLVYVVVAGLGLAGILQPWFGVLQGNYLANAAAISLGLLAISGVIVGFVSLFGQLGVMVGPVVYLLIANPISAAAQPIQFLATPWGALGQWFPPGAAATLLRDLSYFPKTDTSFPWLVLGGWAAAGLIVALVGHLRNTGAATRATMVEAEESAVMA